MAQAQFALDLASRTKQSMKSTGVPARNSQCDSILEAATKALLDAKGEGGNCVRGTSL